MKENQIGFEKIKKLLPLRGDELGYCTLLLMKYFYENVQNFNVEQAFEFGILASDFNLQMVNLRLRIDEPNGFYTSQIHESNDKYFLKLQEYPNLFEFLSERFIKEFTEMPIKKKIEYKLKNERSYFNLPKTIIEQTENDIYKLKKRSK